MKVLHIYNHEIKFYLVC